MYLACSDFWQLMTEKKRTTDRPRLLPARSQRTRAGSPSHVACSLILNNLMVLVCSLLWWSLILNNQNGSSSYDGRSRHTIWRSLFTGARVAEVLQVFASLSRERRWTRASTTSRPLLPPSLDPPSLWTNIKRSCSSFLGPEINRCFNYWAYHVITTLTINDIQGWPWLIWPISTCAQKKRSEIFSGSHSYQNTTQQHIHWCQKKTNLHLYFALYVHSS